VAVCGSGSAVCCHMFSWIDFVVMSPLPSYVEVCCSVLQFVGSVLQYIAVCFSLFRFVSVCGSVLQRVAVY